MNVLFFWTGEKTLRVAAADRTAVMEFCLQNSYPYHSFSWEADGSIRFCLSSVVAARLLRDCRKIGISVEIIRERGIPSLFFCIRKRAGLWVGSLAALSLLILSLFFVWDVRVTGNTTMSAQEVREELRACGFGIGSFLPDVQTGELEITVPQRSERISWLSVYLDGTVARVQVIEEVKPPNGLGDCATPANLVARTDGQIEWMQVYRGNTVVQVGQAVKKGDLLVSGIYDSQTLGYRYTAAAGEVMARTEQSFCIEIPFAYEKKNYGETYVARVCLNFFDFSVKIFENSRNQGGMYDIIETEANANGMGPHPIPVSITVYEATPYTCTVERRSTQETLALAHAQLEKELAALSLRAELLQKEVRTYVREDTLVLECTVKCIENIAERLPFTVA